MSWCLIDSQIIRFIIHSTSTVYPKGVAKNSDVTQNIKNPHAAIFINYECCPPPSFAEQFISLCRQNFTHKSRNKKQIIFCFEFVGTGKYTFVCVFLLHKDCTQVLLTFIKYVLHKTLLMVSGCLVVSHKHLQQRGFFKTPKCKVFHNNLNLFSTSKIYCFWKI